MVRDENHHHMFRRELDGVTTLVTRISHNSKGIDDGLGGLMGNQLCLRLKEFWELVDCPLTESGGTRLSPNVVRTAGTRSSSGVAAKRSLFCGVTTGAATHRLARYR
jgi:hypothetical protein